jgi:hypothetical protein
MEERGYFLEREETLLLSILDVPVAETSKLICQDVLADCSLIG